MVIGREDNYNLPLQFKAKHHILSYVLVSDQHAHLQVAASELLEIVKVQAIIGPETPLAAKFLSILGDKTKVPILSITASPSFNSVAHRYLLQMTQEETIQWKGVAAIAESFKWKGVILVHEDSEFGRESVAYVIESFQEKNIHISYKSAVSLSATDDHIVDELRKLSDLQETIFIIHVPHSIAYRLLVYAKRMGLMTQGYAWIVTDKTMNFFDPVELDVEVLEAFQGVLGLRYFIPSSNQFHNFSRRWRRESLFSNPNIFNALAYDAIFAVAMAVERVEIRHSKNRKKTDVGMSMNFRNIRVSESQMLVFKELLSVRFNGLSGEFHFVNRKSMAMPLEIVNVIGKGERSVGFWTEEDGITMYLKSKPNQHPYSISGLERVIWPGESMIPPRRLILQTRKELRIGVPMHTGFDELLSVEHNPHTNATIAKGFCVDVFNAALDALPYKVPYVFVPFSMARRPNSESYNQLIYQVYLQNYDAVVGDTTITANRSLYVDFTIPYTDLGVGTVARDNHNQRKLWWFLEPLDTHMWVATTCSFFIIGATIWAITLKQKVCAALSSMLTVQQIQLTRRGINIGYQAGSFIEGVIVNNSNFKDPSLRSYYSLAEYARALEGGNKNGGVVAIMDEIPYLKLLLAKYGNAYHLVSYEPSTNGFGFVSSFLR
ncbi:glutamate receptor 2.2 [Helianthus annuus]|uniref:glutamate receptor 2.2 n=1 Tax=Helianthus annuus TaxID=4232 RepID=UPI0016530215|nr:glutamate receptor 2.2 [Helianthus annuus]